MKSIREYMEIVNKADNPSLEWDTRDHCWIFLGYDVHAELLGDPATYLTICSMSSDKSGQGNGERAVRWLKSQTPELVVDDPGSPHDDSYGFWSNMVSKGLIDAMVDHRGKSLYRDGVWA